MTRPHLAVERKSRLVNLKPLRKPVTEVPGTDSTLVLQV